MTTLRKLTVTPEDRAEAIAELRAIFPRGSYVTTVYIRGNRAGDSHDILVLAPSDYSGIRRVSHLVVKAGIGRLTDEMNVRVGGGGMDMAYDIVDSLGRALYGDGYELKHNKL